MERVKRKFYRENGLRFLFKNADDFICCADTITSDRRIQIDRAGNNRWTPDCEEYPYFLAIDHLEDKDYFYLDKLLRSLSLSEHESVTL